MIDQEKSGKYISEKRKQLGITQKELAERVGLTDKAVSKWETGKSIPDSFVLDELCRILNISFNEYISGEDISKENYPDTAEQNMKELIKERATERNHMVVNVMIFIFAGLLILLGLYGILLFPYVRITYFIDVPSFAFETGIALLILLISGIFGDFLKAFVILSQKRVLADEQIERSYFAVKFLIIVNLIAGGFLAAGQCIQTAMGLHGDEHLLSYFALSLLPMWYGLLFDLILIPFLSRLHKLRSGQPSR